LKPQIIHAHWIIPQGFIAAVVCRIIKSPATLICTSHGSDIFALQNLVAISARRYVYKQTKMITAVSRALKKAIIDDGCPKDRICVIPMGVDLKSKFYPENQNRNTGNLLFVGKLLKNKGIYQVIDAMHKIVKMHPATKLAIIGDGPEKAEALWLINRLNIKKHIRFLGPIPNHRLPKYYNQSDIVIFPSIASEGFGLVLVEAMGCGCAVVSSNYDAVCDIVTHGESGLLAKKNDSNAIVEAVDLLLKNHDLKVSIMVAGRKVAVSKFDWHVISEKYKNLMFKILQSMN
jgi:glycosyltransferase involved in cell wall biosynthesis